MINTILGDRKSSYLLWRPLVNLGIFLVWLSFVLVLVHSHVVWRDEVRALSFALHGKNLVEMFNGLRGDSNPALWHFILRESYFVFRDVRVLQALSVIIMAAAAGLLVFKSPFNRIIVIIVLFSEAILYEYPVVARNYGLSVLLLFSIAAVYPHSRNRGLRLGVLLMLLANTNVHSALLGGAFLVFWAIDTVLKSGFRWNSDTRNLLLNVGLYVIGVLFCIVTVYPTFNDAAIGGLRPGESALAQVAQALLQPASRFKFLVLDRTWLPLHADTVFSDSSIARWLMSAVLIGSTFGLIRRPAALIAALLGLLSFSLLFTLIYQGFYRHQALWLVFLIVMYWITLSDQQERPDKWLKASLRVRQISGIGDAAFIFLIIMQVPGGVSTMFDTVLDNRPTSRIRQLAVLIASKPELKDATILADPDYMVEPVPYYIPNPTYLVREGRFGRIVRFSTHSLLNLTLDELLNVGRCIASDSGRPVVFLVKAELDPKKPPLVIKESYDWTFRTTPEMITRFLNATRKLAHFAPVKRTDVGEYYDVYELSPLKLKCTRSPALSQMP